MSRELVKWDSCFQFICIQSRASFHIILKSWKLNPKRSFSNFTGMLVKLWKKGIEFFTLDSSEKFLMKRNGVEYLKKLFYLYMIYMKHTCANDWLRSPRIPSMVTKGWPWVPLSHTLWSTRLTSIPFYKVTNSTNVTRYFLIIVWNYIHGMPLF